MTSSRHVRWLTAGVAAAALTAAPAPSQAQSFYTEAGKPYAGTTIRVLDEITPLQETLSKIVPEFEKETGIKVEWELLNHFEVISKGQADMVSGRGYYDAVMLHGFQMGPMLTAGVIRPIDDLVKNPKLSNPALNHGRFHSGTVQVDELLQGQAVRIRQLELQPGLLGTRRPAERSGRAGRIQSKVWLRSCAGQDDRADA